MPDFIRGCCKLVGVAGENEERVGESVQVGGELTLLQPVSFYIQQAAFGAADDGSGDVQLAGERGATGKDELCERGELAVELVDQLFELFNLLLFDGERLGGGSVSGDFGSGGK